MTDLTWDGYGINIWSTVESCCAIIAACLPTLRPLISRIKALASHTGTKGSAGSSILPLTALPAQTDVKRQEAHGSVAHHEDLGGGESAIRMKELPTSFSHDPYRVKASFREERSPHPVMQSTRFQQERLMAPLSNAPERARSRIP